MNETDISKNKDDGVGGGGHKEGAKGGEGDTGGKGGNNERKRSKSCTLY